MGIAVSLSVTIVRERENDRECERETRDRQRAGEKEHHGVVSVIVFLVLTADNAKWAA